MKFVVKNRKLKKNYYWSSHDKLNDKRLLYPIFWWKKIEFLHLILNSENYLEIRFNTFGIQFKYLKKILSIQMYVWVCKQFELWIYFMIDL